MASALTISQILTIAKICEYLAIVKSAYENAFKGGGINERLARLIYMERMGVQNRYDLNPSDPTLISTSNYLFSILQYQGQAQTILNNLAGSLPVITGPANQSVLVGATATFSVSVISATTVSFQWYLNGILIPGAIGSSYIISNAQLIQSGGLYSVVATNATGSVTSIQGLLTVTASLAGFFTYSPSVDFYPVLLTNSDPFTYGTTYSIVHDAPIVITLPPAMPSNVYILAKVPAGESIKTIWNNTPLNNGTIPDVVFEAVVTFGGWDYYASRGQCTMDVTNLLTLS
jgi:hypothetical protein